MDQGYIQKMQNLGINGGDQAQDCSPSESPRYGRIITKSDPPLPTYHQKQRSMGTIESFEQHAPEAPSEYKAYNTVVTASPKYAIPKQIETISASQNTPLSRKQVEDNDVYVQCAKPPPYSSPVYENVEYYNGAYYHPVGAGGGSQAAQPQVPSGSKQYGNPLPALGEPTMVVYENVQDLSSRATPGPQVATAATYQNFVAAAAQQPTYAVMNSPRSIKAAPQAFVYYHQHNSPPKSLNLSQQQLDEINASDYVCMTGNISQVRTFFHCCMLENTKVAIVHLAIPNVVSKKLRTHPSNWNCSSTDQSSAQPEVLRNNARTATAAASSHDESDS